MSKQTEMYLDTDGRHKRVVGWEAYVFPSASCGHMHPTEDKALMCANRSGHALYAPIVGGGA